MLNNAKSAHCAQVDRSRTKTCTQYQFTKLYKKSYTH